MMKMNLSQHQTTVVVVVWLRGSDGLCTLHPRSPRLQPQVLRLQWLLQVGLELDHLADTDHNIRFSGEALKVFTSSSKSLQPEFISYCNVIQVKPCHPFWYIEGGFLYL